MISVTYTTMRWAGLVAIGSLMGCAHQYAPEATFGLTVQQSIRQQSVRVNGVGHDRIEPGFDGAAAKAVMDRYVRSYEQPQPLGNVLRLGVGTPLTGTGMATATPSAAR
ncbi:MAG: hypothetical protein FGM18_01065 [Burkholderiaceae bacterium]|nr:hypothetical protein [Burkholderiaceae bacterium]